MISGFDYITNYNDFSLKAHIKLEAANRQSLNSVWANSYGAH